MSESQHGVSAQQIEAALRAAITPLQNLQVINESHLHAGHAGAGEGSHFRVKISASAMAGLSRVAQQHLAGWPTEAPTAAALADARNHALAGGAPKGVCPVAH